MYGAVPLHGIFGGETGPSVVIELNYSFFVYFIRNLESLVSSWQSNCVVHRVASIEKASVATMRKVLR
jgi:hypothetical protein